MFTSSLQVASLAAPLYNAWRRLGLFSNMYTSLDQQLMTRALELAALGRYSTPPNPAVGCVIARDEKIVGEGWHRKSGEAHAEPLALAMAGEGARGATAYVTLEPHSYHSRTPPCTTALINAGIKRCVIAMIDPNPKVAGQGVEQLRAAGVAVDLGLSGHAAQRLNRGFVHRMQRKIPWFTLKVGASLDGRVALSNGESRWITSDTARADVQRLRAEASAIVTGIGTVVADDPRLTVRDERFDLLGRQPLRVVCDPSLRTPAHARMFTAPGATLIAYSTSSTEKLVSLKRAGAMTVELQGDSQGRLDLQQLAKNLAERECNEVLIEAGPTLSGAWLASGLVDELVVYQAPSVLGSAARPMFEMSALQKLEDRLRFALVESRAVGTDLRLTFRPLSGGG
jgi:diaminohydroxyphosphoribosylaminopyrimidine deaminase / 5-amino-6-(5-phosphoribosylamino)uracil reductase